jgi:hypothetical protein
MPSITTKNASTVKTKKSSAPSTAPENTAEDIAKVLLHPVSGAVLTLDSIPSVPTGFDRSHIGTEMLAQIAEVKGGDLGRSEAMLVTQTHVLDSLFNGLVQLAMEKHLDVAGVLLPLALKAQNQCRATIEALDRIKNPRSYAVIHQANVTHGPQQVNNGAPAGRPRSKPRQNKIPPIKLSGSKTVELLPHTRAPAITRRANPKLEAVAAVHRPKNARG